MKKSVFFSTLIFVCLVANGLAFEQKDCDFNIVGTWKSATSDEENPIFYRFAPNGTVTVLSRPQSGGNSKWRSDTTFKYKLDDPKAPKAIEFIEIGGDETVKGSMVISERDDDSFITLNPDSETTRWVKVEPHRYFVILAANKGTIEFGGPTFGMMIKTDGRKNEIDTFGMYVTKVKDKTIIGNKTVIRDQTRVGPIPEEIYHRFMNETLDSSVTLLRLEVSSAQFNRTMKIMRSWQRRARENTLLYDVPYLNNMVFLEQMAISLNSCNDKFQLYKLTWNVDDKIMAKNNLTQTGFYYIEELRLMNYAMHVNDEKFHKPWEPINLPSGF